MNFDEWCELFKKEGLTTISVEGATKQIFISDDRSISIMIEERDIDLTKEDERRIQERLKALGYLD